MSKYLLPIFPFIFIVAGYSIYSISKLLVERYSLLNKGTFTITIATITTLFIIANGYKFVIKPKAYYSLNHEVREISNVDYHSVYGLIKTRIQETEEEIAVIDTWPDRTYWYLGRNIQPFYLFRWQNELGVANGHEKRTLYWVNSSNEKMVSSDIRFVGEVDDLVKAMNKYKKGFLLVDDSSMPIDVIQFANDSLFKELYIDHYPLDDNPYSIWPTTLYSWGFDDKAEPVLQ